MDHIIDTITQNNLLQDKQMSDSNTMYVTKRSGVKEEVSFDKITKRLKKLSVNLSINIMELVQVIVTKIYDGIKAAEIDELAAGTCASKVSINPDYGILASRIIISNHHKFTSNSFSEVIQQLRDNIDPVGNPSPIINDSLYNLVMANKDKINSVLDYDNDYKFDYFGFKTLERTYLLKVNERVIERPQHMFMRVCLSIHRDDIKEAIKSYREMSYGYFTHATPTLYNMGTQREQAASCFLVGMSNDSIAGIYSTLAKCAEISKNAGGIGIHIHNIRAKGSYIRGTNGYSNGIVPMLQVFNKTAKYVDQGGQKRPGSIAIYLEPWHGDIEDFLMMKRNTGDPEERARDLFYALWIPDLFMERVQSDGQWTLMCPDKCPGLADVWGDKFKTLYERYEADGKGMKTVSARKLWETMIESQIETGMPYIGFKDSVNRKSNQQNLGTIKSSNLCNEIVEYSSPDEIAVCNLLSVCLPKFLEYPVIQEPIKIYTKSACKYCDMSKSLLTKHGYAYTEVNLDDDIIRRDFFNKLNEVPAMAESSDDPANCVDGACKIKTASGKISTVPQIFIGDQRIGTYNDLRVYLIPRFNYDKLREITKMAVRNLNKLIDYNYYPVPETRTSNMRHRPIGIGIQGLADVFALLRITFESAEAIEMSRKIAEHMYLGACQASMELAKKRKKHVQDYRRLLKKVDRTPDETVQMEHLQTTYCIYPDEVEKLPMKLAGAYSSFVGSPTSEGQLQFDLWGVEPSAELLPEWLAVKDDIKTHGLRNSLLMAMMPTATTAQIMGNNECFEPFTSNIYTRKTLAGSFPIINKYLVADLMAAGLWSTDMKDKIILNNGSVQAIHEIPENIRNLYKTVWEIKQKAILDHAIARAPYICQTQSMNLFFGDATLSKINSSHFYSWRAGLKTGIYYLRTKAKVQGQQFSVDIGKSKPAVTPLTISVAEDDEAGCTSCSA